MLNSTKNDNRNTRSMPCISGRVQSLKTVESHTAHRLKGPPASPGSSSSSSSAQTSKSSSLHLQEHHGVNTQHTLREDPGFVSIESSAQANISISYHRTRATKFHHHLVYLTEYRRLGADTSFVHLPVDMSVTYEQ